MVGRRQNLWGVIVLLVLLLAMVSCERSSTPVSENPTTDPTNDALVSSVDLSASKNIMRNYLGKRDTLNLTATALDQGHVGVGNAHVNFSVVSGPGSIARQDSATNDQGDITAIYVVQIVSENVQQVTIKAEVNGQSDLRTIEIVPQEVKLDMFSSPRTSRWPVDSAATSSIQMFVSDVKGVGVPGVPVRIEKFAAYKWDAGDADWILDTNNEIKALLTPVTSTKTDGSATSTLTLNPVKEKAKIIVKSTVSLPPAQKGSASKGLNLRHRVGKSSGKDSEAQSTAGSGEYQIAASDTVAYDTLIITPFEGAIKSVYVYVDPEHLIVPRNAAGNATVYATAFDEDNVAIPDLPFTFTLEDSAFPDDEDLEIGVISHASSTDSAGVATAVLNTNRRFGTWNITAYPTADPNMKRTTTIHVEESASVSFSLNMFVDDDDIYADNGITLSNVQVRLTDQDDIAVARDTIYFATRYGVTAEYAITDSTGRVNVVFSDVGDTAVYQQAMIRAMYRKNGVTLAEASHLITITEVPAPEILQLTLPTTDVTVHPTDSVRATVQVRTSDLQFVTPGTPIVFVANDIGLFNPTIGYTDDNSIAESYYFYGTHSRTGATLVARADYEGESFYSNNFSINIHPSGAAAIANLGAERTDMQWLDPLPNPVSCVVLDTFNNRVEAGIGVQFTSDKGTMSGSGLTDANGIASSNFSAGTEAGVVKIKAALNNFIAESTYVNINAGNAASIALSANLSEIQVYGTGGNETSRITAVVTDASGNAVESDTVHFLLTQFPRDTTGPEPRRQPTLGGSDGSNTYDPDSPFYTPYVHQIYGYGLPYVKVATNSGIANVSITSGTAKGSFQLLAWVGDYDPVGGEGTGSVASFVGLQVVAGPPDHIELDVNMAGYDLQGAAWGLEVSARVQDIRGNDVSDGYAVIFGSDNPEVHIGEARTGNTSVSGDSSDGVAYSILTYQSISTNEEITLFASVRKQDGTPATDQFTFALPIQGPQGIMYTDLLNWNYTVRAEDPAHFDIEIFVMDGHNHYVNNQLVRFLTNKGRYYANSTPNGFTGETQNELTGLASRLGLPTDGWADLFLVITEQEGFPEPVNETTAQASAEIVGYNDATIEPIVLTLYR